MKESELRHLLELAETHYPAPSRLREELWEELDSAWETRRVEATAFKDEAPVRSVTGPVSPRQSGWIVTLASAAAAVVLVGLAPFLLMRFSAESAPPLSGPEIVASPEDACLVFAVGARGVAHLITDSTTSESPGSPWLLPYESPPSNQLVVADLETLVAAMDDLLSYISQLDEVNSSVIDSLRVVRGYYNQAITLLQRGDGGSASSSVDSAKSQWSLMDSRGQFSGLPGCYPGQ